MSHFYTFREKDVKKLMGEKELQILEIFSKELRNRKVSAKLFDPIADSTLNIRLDEPYAEEVYEIIKKEEIRKGTWDLPDKFEDYLYSLIHIPQRFSGDCSIASLAMFLNRTYEEVESIVDVYDEKAKHNGVFIRTTMSAAQTFGYILSPLIETEPPFKADTKYYIVEQFNLEKKSLLTVDSLNHEGKLHEIYWDGKRVYDPSPKRKYTELPDTIHLVLQELICDTCCRPTHIKDLAEVVNEDDKIMMCDNCISDEEEKSCAYLN